ncbi:hypothetical protein R9X47_06010 [Wukongibacter baidiensis]|uniref:hypothetical protein n=1 Tax=Wukongibacter baidiensis TaxID=1723361 RepID=UPI003D7FD9C5
MLYRVPRPPFGGPPFFQPGQFLRPPTGRPGGGPGGGFVGDDEPPGRPPSFTPEQGPALAAVDPGAIRRCRYKFTYLWLKNRRQFWSYLTFVGRTSVAGYRWNGHRWVYFGTDLRNIESFVCY